MGISISTIKLIARTFRNNQLGGNCVTFGVQGIAAQYPDLIRILKHEKFDYKTINDDEVIIDKKTQFGNTVHQSVLFKLLGFSRVDSIDLFANEDPTHVLNLNEPIPSDLFNQYAMVYDGGTLEHCFNIYEVLSNAVKLLAKDGFIVHHVPLSGYINHGFYQFSPTLFFDFYGANGFIDMKEIIHIKGWGNRTYWFDFDMKNTFLPPNSENFLGRSSMIFFVARKNSTNSRIVSPTQGYYSRLFGQENSSSKKYNYRQKIIDSLKRSVLAYDLATFIYSRYKMSKIKKHRLT